MGGGQESAAFLFLTLPGWWRRGGSSAGQMSRSPRAGAQRRSGAELRAEPGAAWRRQCPADGRSRSRSLGRWEIWKSPRCRGRGGEGGGRGGEKGEAGGVEKGETETRSAIRAGSEFSSAPGSTRSVISHPLKASTPSQGSSAFPQSCSPCLLIHRDKCFSLKRILKHLHKK